MYLFNDLIDLKFDRLHPYKKLRPYASGMISRGQILSAGIILGISGLSAALALNTSVFFILLAYSLNTLVYSFYLKHKVLADVLSISFGFMLRFIGGALIIGVDTSRWFLVCTFSLSLFLAFGKRRAELESLKEFGDPAGFRKTLGVYTKENLDTALSVMNSICILSYLLFVTDPETIQRHRSTLFIYTVPLVVYCLFKYMYKVQEGTGGGGPVDIIVKDKAFMGAIVLWLLMVLAILTCPHV